AIAGDDQAAREDVVDGVIRRGGVVVEVEVVGVARPGADELDRVGAGGAVDGVHLPRAGDVGGEGGARAAGDARAGGGQGQDVAPRAVGGGGEVRQGPGDVIAGAQRRGGERNG